MTLAQAPLMLYCCVQSISVSPDSVKQESSINSRKQNCYFRLNWETLIIVELFFLGGVSSPDLSRLSKVDCTYFAALLSDF